MDEFTLASDSEFTDSQWCAIDALALGWRNDGYDPVSALHYAIMDYRRILRNN